MTSTEKRKYEQITRQIKRMSYRQAQREYGISPRTIRQIKSGRLLLWIPRKARPRAIDPQQVAAVLESVKANPHWNTAERAARLGIRTETTQKILAERGLSKLNARLSYAGYSVEPVRALAIARMRRIVAASPGAITEADYKTYGLVRGVGEAKARRVGGYIFIDCLTGYAQVLIWDKEDAEGAVKALQKYVQKAPFKPWGIILTDNGAAFLSDQFVEAVRRIGCQMRTTTPYHPWSNGKAEAFNKTLKYQCFPVVLAKSSASWEKIQSLVDEWVSWYNSTRVHSGRLNRGLPPLVLYRQWLRAPGNTNLDRLRHLGIIRSRDLPYLRILGQPKGKLLTADPKQTARALAFVIDRSGTRYKPRGARIPLPAPPKPNIVIQP